jgi:hypothetical protein
MRVVDYLLEESWVTADHNIPNVDDEHILITGHSRRGKTALIAAAYDERITMVVPSGSGCGGLGSFLVLGPGSETLGLIASEKRYKSWFQADFNRFAANLKDLPFDQHYIRALLAPRIVMSKEGLEDKWANPVGTQAIYQAAQPVFNLLGVPLHNAIYYRDGGHSYTAADFNVVLDFADFMWFNATISAADRFWQQPFPFQVSVSP